MDYHLIILLAYEDNKREIYTAAAEDHRNIQVVSCASTFICRGHSWEEVEPRLGK